LVFINGKVGIYDNDHPKIIIDIENIIKDIFKIDTKDLKEKYFNWYIESVYLIDVFEKVGKDSYAISTGHNSIDSTLNFIKIEYNDLMSRNKAFKKELGELNKKNQLFMCNVTLYKTTSIIGIILIALLSLALLI